MSSERAHNNNKPPHTQPPTPTHAARARLLPALEALELEEAEDEELNGQQRRNVEPVVLEAGEVPARPFRRSSVSDWLVGWLAVFCFNWQREGAAGLANGAPGELPLLVKMGKINLI